MKWILALCASLVLGGCATPVPFNTVTLGGAPTVMSTKTATLEQVSGVVRGGSGTTLVPAGTVFIPISTGPIPRLQFHAQDQAEFLEVLKAELLRLKVFKAVDVGSAPPSSENLRITVIFAQTYHQPGLQEYQLDVVMNIEGGRKPFLKRYYVNSNEKASLWEQWNTSAFEGKVLAVRRLLEKLVPDIQAYVAEHG